MTKETAKRKIEMLDSYLQRVNDYGESDHEAMMMATKALEQEPCEDCISREQAKKAIRDKFKDLPSRAEINTILNELPPVTPTACIAKVVFDKEELQKMVDEKVKELVISTQEWIPVSEKLPEDVGEYLVTISFDIGGKEPVRETRRNYFCSSKKWLHDNDEVIAWMLSPKPYGKESEEK